MSRIDAVAVAVPARDEESRLPRALEAVRVAADDCGVPVVVAVGADACTDRTAELAREAGAEVVELRAARVGTARRAAVAAALERIGGDPARVWIASTDADSVVPPDWLTTHLRFADRGVQLLRGAVRPDPHELAAEHLLRWTAAHPPAEQHGHVHAANLGVRADAYLAAGGFGDLEADEDVALVRAVEQAGGCTASTSRAPVVTSARLVGRAPHGFAAYLRDQLRAASVIGPPV